LTAFSIRHPELLSQAFASVYEAFWVRRESILDIQTTISALTAVFGEDMTNTMHKASSNKEVKDRLKSNTDAAFEDGAFGLPWFVATNSQGETECFFGFNCLAQVTEHLGLEKPRHGGWRSLL
jgi:2-hydroxychromene-2-carboxylate isomerase